MSSLETDKSYQARMAVMAHRDLGNLTWKEAAVICCIIACIETGECRPSEASLAALAKVSLPTVQRAKKAAHRLSLIGWRRCWAVVGGRNRERPCFYFVVEARPVVVKTPRPRREHQREVARQELRLTVGIDLLLSRRMMWPSIVERRISGEPLGGPCRSPSERAVP